jgi:hypothetical protein
MWITNDSPLPRGLPALAVAALSVAVLACGDTTEPEPDPGVFEAAVSGEHSAGLDGEATFGIYSGEGFRLLLTPKGAATHVIEIGYRPQSRPGIGSYPILDPTATELDFTAHYTHQAGGASATFRSRSGEFLVTTSTPTRMEGTFTFQATATLPGSTEELEVTVEGAFSAPCVTVIC